MTLFHSDMCGQGWKPNNRSKTGGHLRAELLGGSSWPTNAAVAAGRGLHVRSWRLTTMKVVVGFPLLILTNVWEQTDQPGLFTLQL